MSTLLGYKVVTAHAYHRCDWCGGSIRPGDRYERSGHVEDGSAYTWKAHRPCSYLAHEFTSDYDDDGLTTAEWWEALLLRWSEVPALLAGNYSMNHPAVVMVRSAYVRVAELPIAWGTSASARARRNALAGWHDGRRGEIVRRTE